MSWEALSPLAAAISPRARAAVRRVADAPDAVARRAALRRLVAELGDRAADFALHLAGAASPAGRRLALELMSRVEPRERFIQPARRLLPQRDVPLGVRLSATRALINAPGADAATAARLLRAFAAGLGRSRPLERLERLAGRLGHPPALADVRARLSDRQRLRCPRCGIQRRRRRMTDHLWAEHQLVLDGRRAVTVERLIDDRLGDAGPAAALVAAARSVLARGIRDAVSVESLQADAADQHESFCPHCFAAVPAVDLPLPRPAEVAPGRLAAGACRVVISRRNWRPWLRAEEGGRIVADRPCGGAGLSPLALLWLGAACGAVALAAAVAAPHPWNIPVAATALVEGGLLVALARASQPSNRARVWQVVDAAWEVLAPALPPSEELTRLALASFGRGRVRHRSANLDAAMAAAELAVRGRTAAPGVVAALWSLRADDARRSGRDAVPELASRLGDCFSGALPPACAAATAMLLRATTRQRDDRARLRVLALEQAFEHGLGVWDLVEIGRAFPPLGQLLNTDDLDGLARLRFVWERRDERPWHARGPASSAFELARFPSVGGRALADAPDLLLYLPLPGPGPGAGPEPLALCGRGVVFRGAVARDRSVAIRVRPRAAWRGGGYELVIGPHRFRYAADPAPVARQLVGWVQYYFDHLLPGSERVLRYRAGGRLEALLAPAEAPCPACGRRLIPVPGAAAVPRA
jgi:hypothetical protein